MEISAMKLNEDKLQEVVIDFSEWRSNVLNESWLRMFWLNIEYLLKAMFGGNMVNAKIRGNKREINSFARTLSREKKYMDTFLKYGLDNPRTYKSRYKLESSIRNFERNTGLKWPIK